MSIENGGVRQTDSRGLLGTARYMSRELARLFRAHDGGYKQEAIDACRAVDELQFPTLDADEVDLAATAFVEAMWEKDEVELAHMRNGKFDRDSLRDADYSSVSGRLRERAAIIGADQAYATAKTKAWRRHKTGGDYWTPFQRSQVYELRAILGDPAYPNKPRAGQSGFGPEAARYALAFELHDMHTEDHWQQGIDVMVPYFSHILRAHTHESNQ